MVTVRHIALLVKALSAGQAMPGVICWKQTKQLSSTFKPELSGKTLEHGLRHTGRRAWSTVGSAHSGYWAVTYTGHTSCSPPHRPCSRRNLDPPPPLRGESVKEREKQSGKKVRRRKVDKCETTLFKVIFDTESLCNTTDIFFFKTAPQERVDLLYLLHTPASHTIHQRCSRRSYTWGSEWGLCRAGSGPSSAHSSSPWCDRRPQDRRPDIGLYTGNAPFQTYLEGGKKAKCEVWCWTLAEPWLATCPAPNRLIYYALAGEYSGVLSC